MKQALVAADIDSSNYGCIRASTKGLVFFATPHGGGNLAGLADVAASLVSAMTGSAKNSLLKTLKKNSLLNEIAKDQFQPQSGDYEVLTLVEGKMMDVHFKNFIKYRMVPQITSMVCFVLPDFRAGIDKTYSTLSIPIPPSSGCHVRWSFAWIAIIPISASSPAQETMIMRLLVAI